MNPESVRTLFIFIPSGSIPSTSNPRFTSPNPSSQSVPNQMPYLVESPSEEDKTRSFYFNRGSHSGVKRAKNSDDDEEDEDSCSYHGNPNRGYEDNDGNYDSCLSRKGLPVKFCIGEERVTPKFSHMGLWNWNQNAKYTIAVVGEI